MSGAGHRCEVEAGQALRSGWCSGAGRGAGIRGTFSVYDADGFQTEMQGRERVGMRLLLCSVQGPAFWKFPGAGISNPLGGCPIFWAARVDGESALGARIGDPMCHCGSYMSFQGPYLAIRICGGWFPPSYFFDSVGLRLFQGLHPGLS